MDFTENELEIFVDKYINGPNEKAKALANKIKYQGIDSLAMIIMSPDLRRALPFKKQIKQLPKRDLQIFQELMIYVPLKYIYWRYGIKYCDLFPVTDQGGVPVCWAHSIATIVVLQARRIIGHKELNFVDIKEDLVNKYGKKGNNVEKVLSDISSKYNFRFKKVDEKNINLFNPCGSYQFYICNFTLTDEQWTKFSNFYAKNNYGILTSEDIGPTPKDYVFKDGDGHSVVLIDQGECSYTFLNSWGTNFANQGKFRVEKNALPIKEFYSVFWYEDDLPNEYKVCYENRLKDAIENFYKIYDYSYMLYLMGNINENALKDNSEFDLVKVLNDFIEDFWRPGIECNFRCNNFIDMVDNMLNDSSHLLELANKLRQGIDVKVDKEEACKYYKKAADLGNSDAMFNYADMLYHGDGVQADKEEACKYCKKAADLGNSDAMFNYAYMLELGDGVQADKEEACKYYQMAIDLGNSGAMNNYAYMLEHSDGVQADKEKAIKLYLEAIRLNNSFAMKNYARMLLHGDGVPVDIIEAKNLYLKAIELGNPKAMNDYAYALEHGIGFKVDKEEAIKYYQMAIKLGNSDAKYNLGCMWVSMGIELFKEAAGDKNEKAIQKLKELNLNDSS